MASLLKDSFNTQYFSLFCSALKKTVPSFREKTFLSQVFSPDWEGKELKERMRHVTLLLPAHLPGDFSRQVEALTQTLEKIYKTRGGGHLADLIFPDFIEVFGLAHPQESLNAMETITQFISCEFAVRPFLKADQEMVLRKMLEWSEHPHHHVRRFSSEGCRPRLPWAMALPALKKDPAPILPILENLKADSSLFVRKSVANNLNDIAKDHPGVVKELIGKWKGYSPETDWILKHGSRTLLKKADPEALAFFGWGGKLKTTVSVFKLSKKKVQIGEEMSFSFNIELNEKKAAPVRIEFAVHYMKANGTQSRKIFQLSQTSLEPGKQYTFKRKLSFRDLTTRKHHKGAHQLGIVVNGKDVETLPFTLV